MNRGVSASAEQEAGLRERKKQRTHRVIADAALDLFLERGFDAVSVADVARRAEVDAKTIYNYFTGKPELLYHRFEELESSLLDAVRRRGPGESIVSAFGNFLLSREGLLADDEASDRLRAINRMITESPALLAHEEQVFGRITASFAALIAEETGARSADVQAWVVANALIGFHRALVRYVRRETLAGKPNANLRRELRAQAKKALAGLEHGFANYGVKLESN